jgi:hypothetical protein
MRVEWLILADAAHVNGGDPEADLDAFRSSTQSTRAWNGRAEL